MKDTIFIYNAVVLMLVINHLGPPACMVNSYTSELQTVVNESIYNGN